MTIILTRKEIDIIAEAIAYYLDHNVDIDFNDEKVNALYERVLELKKEPE